MPVCSLISFWTKLLTKARILDEFRMAAKPRQIILNDPDYVMETNRFYYGMKLGTIKAKSNAAGLLLSHLGLFEPRQKPA